MVLHQGITLFFVFFLSVVGFLLIDRGLIKNSISKGLLVFCVYSVVALIVFYPTITCIFRSDYWAIATLFSRQMDFTPESLKNISLFALFGHPRFQPFANLLLYARHILFGDNIILYNLLNIMLHMTTGFLVYKVLSRLVNSLRLAYLFGLLFLTLISHFDTVVWTYHIYVIVGTIITLWAILLVINHVETGGFGYFVAAISLAVLSALMYEPAFFAPATLFCLVLGLHSQKGKSLPRAEIYRLMAAVDSAYLLYLSVTLYGFTLVRHSNKISLPNISFLMLLYKSIRAVGVDLVGTIFAKNIGIVRIQINDLVYVKFPEHAFTHFEYYLKAAIGITLLLFFRIRKKNWYVEGSLIFLAISYIFIISFGRIITNNTWYIIEQPRYQYFIDAIFLIIAGLLLWSRYQGGGKYKAAILSCLVVIFLVNTSNVLHANNEVSNAMRPMDNHYYRMKDFLRERPSAKIFLSFTPFNDKFYLGTDFALDTLFKNSITKFINKAQYIYDGKAFIKNPDYSDERNPYMKDFIVSWMFQYGSAPGKDVGIVGSGSSHPSIALTPDGFVKVVFVNNGGRMDVYRVKLAYPVPNPDLALGNWASIAIEKHGEDLCFFFNGNLIDKVRLEHAYKEWSYDGADLLGGYYSGTDELTVVGSLFIQSDAPRYKCSSLTKGDKVPIDTKTIWKD